MKKIVIIILAALLCACQKITTVHEEPRQETANIVLSFSPATEDIITRSPNDTAIKDLNIYLFHKKIEGADRHFYLTDGTTECTLTLVTGDYILYALANTGKNEGEMSRSEIENMKYLFPDEASLLKGDPVLSTKEEISVQSTQRIAITLRRMISRVDFSLSVAPEISGRLQVESVKLVKAPVSVLLFANNRPFDLNDYTDYAVRKVEANSYSGTFYLPENIQGINSKITKQVEKSMVNAPRGASYLHITASMGEGNKMDYFVYLGENNTSDFNCFRNKQYRINTVITGTNSVDTRVSTVKLSLSQVNDEYEKNEQALSTLSLSCMNNPDNEFTLSYRIIQGSGKV